MVPRGERTGLLVVDMLNPYDHDDADRLAASVREAVPNIGIVLEHLAEAACEMMESNMRAEIAPAHELQLKG